MPAVQWESAEALAFRRRQIIWMIILPQCVKRMLPPWMNLYAILTMATVLAMNPKVMLFDEVTSALDPETVKEVLVTFRELAEEGMTCLLVTHEMGFAREVAHQVYFVDHARVIENGPPGEFFRNAKDPRTREFPGQIL